MNEIIEDVNDLDDLDLDLDDDTSNEITDSVEIGSNDSDSSDDDLDLDFEDDIPDTCTTQPTVDTDDLNVESDPDDLELGEDDDVSLDDVSLENQEGTATDDLTPDVVDPLDSEIDLDLELNEQPKATPKVEKAETPKVEKPKKSKATRKKKDKMMFNPKLALLDINTEKYKTRRNNRTSDDIKDLAHRIKVQGLVEAIQVVKIEETLYLLSGFGRKMALDSLGILTAKAIIHENITESQIYKICSGSNEARTELTEWDKMCSIADYKKRNPVVDVDGDSEDAITNVFGYARSTVFYYLKLHKFYAERPDFIKFFDSTNNLSGYIYTMISKVMSGFKESELADNTVVEIVKDILSGSYTRNTFKALFTDRIADVLSGNSTADKSSVTTTELNEKLHNDKIAREEKSIEDQIEKIENSANKSDLTPVPDTKAEKKIAETVDNMMQIVLDSVADANDQLKEMMKIEGFKKYINPDKFKSFNGIVSKITKSLPNMI